MRATRAAGSLSRKLAATGLTLAVIGDLIVCASLFLPWATSAYLTEAYPSPLGWEVGPYALGPLTLAIVSLVASLARWRKIAMLANSLLVAVIAFDLLSVDGLFFYRIGWPPFECFPGCPRPVAALGLWVALAGSVIALGGAIVAWVGGRTPTEST